MATIVARVSLIRKPHHGPVLLEGDISSWGAATAAWLGDYATCTLPLLAGDNISHLSGFRCLEGTRLTFR